LISAFEQMVPPHPGEVAAFLAEPVVGSALGAAGPTATYFERIAAICRAHDILLIADEVMTGFGRTGARFGCEHYGTHADIMACAKGISGGYIPLGAILVRDEVATVLRDSGDPFLSGQTYSCIPLAAEVGRAVLDEIEDQGLVQNSRDTGAYLLQRMRTVLGELDCVGECRGTGLFLGVEFVEDKATKAPFPDSLRFSKRVQAAALKRGVVVLGAKGTVDRLHGDHLLLAPPLILTEAHADELVEGLRLAISDAMGG